MREGRREREIYRDIERDDGGVESTMRKEKGPDFDKYVI